jgi:DNA-binding transcriptional LysR family regulator
MDWENLHAFLEVARNESLTRAARSLGLDDDAVSHRIELLEYRLGTVLFNRTDDGLSLTEAARDLVAIAQAMEEAADAFVRQGSADTESSAGTVRVTTGDVIGIEVLPTLIADLREAHPDLVIQLEIDNDQRRRLSSAAHIAVCMFEPSQKGLLSHFAGPVHVGIFAHQRYLDRAGTPLSIADLKHHTLLGSQDETQAIRFMGALGLHLTERDFAFRTDSQVGHIAALRAGVGVGVCHAPLAARDPGLVRVLPSLLDFTLPAWVAMHEDARNGRSVRIVYDALVEHMSAYAAGKLFGPGEAAADQI